MSTIPPQTYHFQAPQSLTTFTFPQNLRMKSHLFALDAICIRCSNEKHITHNLFAPLYNQPAYHCNLYTFPSEEDDHLLS